MADWREHYTYKQYLFLLKPTTVFAARVNQASFTYALPQVTYDTVTTGAYTDIKNGMTVVFGTAAGLSDLGRGRIRKTPTSTILYIGWASQGVHDGECNLADDAYITVWDDHRVWAKIPRLENFQEQYKDYDLAYTAGADIPPFANGGPGVAKLVDASNEISVDFAGVATVTDPGAAITTHAWDFGDGTPSSGATAAVNGVTFPAGFRWVSYTVTDDNATTHTHYVPVAALTNLGAEVSYSGATYDESTTEGIHTADQSFDDDLTTWWHTADGVTTGWVEVTFSTAVTIAGYSLRNGSTMHIGKNPTAWTVKTGTGLTTIDSQTGVTWAADQTKTYILDDPVTSTVFRMDISANNGHGLNVGVVEWDLLINDPNYITNFDVVEQTLTREGQLFRVAIHDDIAESEYPDGTLVMYMEREFYDGVEGSLAGFADREHMKFVGWHATDPAAIDSTETGLITSTEFECHDIAARMRSLPAFSSIVGRIGTSTAWYLLPSAHTDRYIHYLLHWHSTVLDVAPFTWSGTGGTYALPWFATTATSLWEQINFRTQSIAHALTVSMRGELKMLPDPQLLDSGDRTSTVITDIDPQDWSNIVYTHQRPPRVHWLWASAIVASTLYISQTGLTVNSVFCAAPGEAPGQGANEQTQGEQVVVDQDELNAREGHRYAARLNPEETNFDISLVHGGDVGIDPATMTWVRTTITSTQASERGLTFTDERFLPFQVTINHNPVGVGEDHTLTVKDVVVSAEREVIGTPAATDIPATGDVVPTTSDPDDWPTIYEDDPTYDLDRGAATIGLFDNTGLLHTTTTFNVPEVSGGPDWATVDLTGLSPALSGTFLAMVGDPFSPLYINTGTTVNGWIVTSTGIYSITDVFGVAAGPTLGLQHTLASAGANYGAIGLGVGAQNWVVAVVAYKSAPGTKAVYTTDGSSWTEATITAHYNTDAVGFSARYKPPLFVSSATGGVVYAGALTSTGSGPPGDLYKSTDNGATWAVATDIDVDFGDYHGGLFSIPWHDNAGQLLSYHGNHDLGAGTYALHRTEADGTTITDISPSGSYGVPGYGFWQLGICPTDRQRLAFLGYNQGTGNSAIFVSKDAGTTWTAVTTPGALGSGYMFVAVARNDPDVIYTWGNDLQVGYTQDNGFTWQDKTTKLAGSADIINIIGG